MGKGEEVLRSTWERLFVISPLLFSVFSWVCVFVCVLVCSAIPLFATLAEPEVFCEVCCHTYSGQTPLYAIVVGEYAVLQCLRYLTVVPTRNRSGRVSVTGVPMWCK